MKNSLIRYAILAVAVVTIGVGASVAAQDSRLTQEITGVDCVANPSDPECPPAIQSIVINGGRPILSGRYNSVASTQLRITLNGVAYVLGVDSQLTATGDNWELDLSELEPALSPGDYSVLVESMDADGNWLSTSEVFTVAASSPEDGEGADSDEGQPGGGWLGETGEPVVLAVVGALVMIAIAVVVIGAKKKRKKGKN